jgi:predicted short-subunit dehydrogenase-like oxidoreductase (DUF2520 family)
MEKSLAIVGAGRVGRALGRRLHAAGWRIGAVVTRSTSSARNAVRFIGAGRPFAKITSDVARSRVILIAVPDDAIAGVAAELAAACGKQLQGRIVLHTSGARNSSVLQAIRECGAAPGSMHPMQTFSGISVPPLQGKVFTVEGHAKAISVSRQIVKQLGGITLILDAGKKSLYHAGAVMAAGHVLALLEAATRVLIAAGFNRSRAKVALLPLTTRVLENFDKLGSRVAWTGPQARGDFEIMSQHREALRQLPREFGEAYEALNHLAARVLGGRLRGPNRAQGRKEKQN